MKSNIYTRTGDHGQTSLVGGQRVEKDCARLESYGTIDELNSHIGLLIAMLTAAGHDTQVHDWHLQDIQDHLFVIGAHLATDCSTTQLRQASIVTDQMISDIETLIDTIDQSLPQLRAFVLPGGSMAAAQCHVCRTVCRRAERRILTLCHTDHVDQNVVRYVNRLSDLLFVLARKINIIDQNEEIFWNNTCRNK
ncbi:MAG: cob(I)yrinic acid a,c-diamide adenosyltransferase [Bacteroidaceae bacterium]|nr:cob(I)yrinic acid a,c-diamide adenosyltransferase [Bacteroidaceae bacterium]